MSKNPHAERFGGSGSSHRDREHPHKNNQPTGHKGGEDSSGALPGEPTNSDRSRTSGGDRDRDRHHTHTPARS